MSKELRNVIVIVGAFFVFVAAIVGGWMFYTSWEGDTTEIVAVADQFKPENDWKLNEEIVEPPKLLCYEGPCPRVGREWVVNEFVKMDMMRTVLDESGWDEVKAESPECFDLYRPNENNVSCVFSGKVDGYIVSIFTSSSDPVRNIPTVNLYIKEAHD